jgi:hypothetical protein
MRLRYGDRELSLLSTIATFGTPRWLRLGIRTLVAGAKLSELGAVGGRFSADKRPTLNWVLFHVLQEYTRHAGHLDIVRELADGSVGE